MGVTTQESAFGYITSAATLTNGLLVNGTVITTATATSIADVIAAANNASSSTGVTASRSLTNVSTVVYTPPALAASITINGVNIGIPALATAAQLTSSINAASAQTGVAASFVGGTLTFTAANGGDAILSQSAAGILSSVNGNVANTVGLGTLLSPATTIAAGVTFSSKLGAQPVIAENGAGTLATALNVLSGASAVTGTYQVSTLDVSTIANATKAMQTVDFALAQVASTAAQLGAIQNRFTATVANLQTAATNLSASRSSIQDADFAAETANLSRTQVLQQAGTAILAQANQIPNTVLKLLQ
jgi:flagellin